ncbi:DEAD/DEAH box helicase [Halorubrum sp. AD140]|uniref:DEAD/DEAH box helicase n=1 Tax=Halorubrum sp. AD140 TaxID=3050073 RepID=UPI002ACCCD0B|nr:DEAD/DEAH box helicase [Halorubrum sp. AD140]MDZ5811544.1 DEAD/DEAH box helicase [Halorubrum sp. AD140]
MPPIPESIPESDQELIQELLDQKPPEFTDLTLTQYEAFENGALDEGNHLLIAETGNGKTFVAEAVTKKALQDGKKVAYLVPSVALVGEKHATVSAWTPKSVTVNKGRGYKEADVVVATFESFFEAVVRGYADRFDTVILDDFHEIYSSQRGPNIEKGISAALDAEMEILGISATVGNPHTIARWLDAELTISSEERAVPIKEIPIEKGDEEYALQIARIIRDNRDKGPFLVFNDTTRNAEARARGVADELTFDTGEDVNFRAKVEEAVKTELTDTHENLIELLNNGVAYHHSKLERGVKDLIEEYTEKGVIKCVFCTTTLSYGFDSPVQSVIVADLRRNWEGGFIGVYEYVQWIGRAGRDADEYDQAYAFLMYNDENAFEEFQFDTRVEEKDIEDVASHLSGQIALRWLVLELVNYGWETDVEVTEFVQSTLFWSESVEQVPQYIRDDLAEQPGADVEAEIQKTLTWLTNHGLLHKPIGQPQSEQTRYTATDLGSALVEYEHSNWFDNSVERVLELTEWLNEQESDLTPEKLVQRFAEEYYHCDEVVTIDDEGGLNEKMDLHNLSGTEGSTAVLICWFWCAGVPITDIEDYLGGDDMSSLVNTASNLSIAVKSARLLYEPFEMPEEPEWLEMFAAQVAEGVPGPDMYLISNVDYFGRAIYNNLRDQLNRTGGRDASWDPGTEHFVIERLSKLLADSGEDLFVDTVRSTHRIGDAISQNLLKSVLEWDPESDERIEVPFAESALERPGSDGLTRYHELIDDEESENSSSEGEIQSGAGSQPTTLNDFN